MLLLRSEPTREQQHNQNLGLKYTAILREVVGKMCTRQCRKVIWDKINIQFSDTVAVEPKHMSMASRAMLSNFFEEQ